MKWYRDFYCYLWLPVKKAFRKWWKKDDQNDHFDHPYIIL
jgi:hypothetical protein